MPTEYGGGGGDFLHHVILHEEMGYSPAGASMGGGFGIDGSSYLILAGGTEEQKREWIPRYASGETIAEACFTEPQSGSDVAGFRTHARSRATATSSTATRRGSPTATSARWCRSSARPITRTVRRASAS